MGTYQFDKLFSVHEASELIPTLELLIRDLQSQAKSLRVRLGELRGEEPEGGQLALAALVERYPELREPASRIAAIVRQIEEHGCFLKDIDLGLIDFPWAIADDHVVFLCWQSGEPTIAAWHAVESGFGERQQLPGVTKPYLN